MRTTPGLKEWAKAPGLKEWLGSPCEPNRLLTEAISFGLARPTDVPAAAEVWVGGQLLHSTHVLAVFRGLYFCRRCGCYATLVPKLLKLECQGFPAAAGRSLLRRLASGRLPVGLACWPADQEPEALDGFVEL